LITFDLLKDLILLAGKFTKSNKFWQMKQMEQIVKYTYFNVNILVKGNYRLRYRYWPKFRPKCRFRYRFRQFWNISVSADISVRTLAEILVPCPSNSDFSSGSHTLNLKQNKKTSVIFWNFLLTKESLFHSTTFF
jgi:hypothetical protein